MFEISNFYFLYLNLEQNKNQIPYSGIFHRTRTNYPKIYMELQKTQNCQSNPEEKEKSWTEKSS